MSSVTRLVVSGFPSCPFYQRAKEFATAKASDKLTVRFLEFPRDQFHTNRIKTLGQMGLADSKHTTCPLVYLENDKQAPVSLIGGFDSLRAANL